MRTIIEKIVTAIFMAVIALVAAMLGISEDDPDPYATTLAEATTYVITTEEEESITEAEYTTEVSESETETTTTTTTRPNITGNSEWLPPYFD